MKRWKQRLIKLSSPLNLQWIVLTVGSKSHVKYNPSTFFSECGKQFTLEHCLLFISEKQKNTLNNFWMTCVVSKVSKLYSCIILSETKHYFPAWNIYRGTICYAIAVCRQFVLEQSNALSCKFLLYFQSGKTNCFVTFIIISSLLHHLYKTGVYVCLSKNS